MDIMQNLIDRIYGRLYKNLEAGNQTNFLIMDFSKSFDKIRNSLLPFVSFVDIDGIVDYRCLNFLFIHFVVSNNQLCLKWCVRVMDKQIFKDAKGVIRTR